MGQNIETSMGRTGELLREQIEVTGVVQGVGFRPFVYTLACRLGLSGFVGNHSAGVTIQVEGDSSGLRDFLRCLQEYPPPLARIDAIHRIRLPVKGSRGFQMISSESIPAGRTSVGPDVATCDQCLKEMKEPSNRRFRYPFINCTNCGPRFTIIRAIPYDRPLTTMNVFPMCEACEKEYREPSDRRYHAQPNSCPRCGPSLWFIKSSITNDRANFERASGSVGESAIRDFHNSINNDEIVAVKGIGGFHLVCSAYSLRAVEKLRMRKGRSDKPLAIMVADVAAANRIAVIHSDEERLLNSPARPIVLLNRRRDTDLPTLLAPGTTLIGILLPYSPLHELMIEGQTLVMTSANISDEPIMRTNGEAFERLRHLSDAFLLHDREIHVACDDSVVRSIDGRETPIRRSRGYAPLPVRWNFTDPDDVAPGILATGGDLKNTFCFAKGDKGFLSPHMGDLTHLQTLLAFRRGVDHFQKLFHIEPEIIACDLHPAYTSSQWAREQARTLGLRLVEVQHHHAHIASVLAEHRIDPKQLVIGISFDGTGYGPDGTIWGGEVLIASCQHYERWAHLKAVLMPGGDHSVRFPFRAALAHLWAAGLPWDVRLPCVASTESTVRNVLQRQLERSLNCYLNSSMGRLFDAVSSLIGVRQIATYEAQAALEMEALCGDSVTEASYPLFLSPTIPCLVDPTPMLEAIVRDVMDRRPPGNMISRFHNTIAHLIVELCERARTEKSINTVVLGGGVFQNRILSGRTIPRLESLGFIVLTNRIVPPNDGGISLGQAVIAQSIARR